MSQSWHVIQVPSLTLDNAPSIFCMSETLVAPTLVVYRALHIGKATFFWHHVLSCAPGPKLACDCPLLSHCFLLPKQRQHILPLVFQALSCRAGHAHMLNSWVENPGLCFSGSFCQPCVLGQDGSIANSQFPFL